MNKPLCIHGHFYQPPREDPWLEEVLPEAGAAPSRNWNERIFRECYDAMSWARRLDDTGRIYDIVNCFEWISFNFGPTLLRWMSNTHPRAVERIVEGDKRSALRLGHGNALAQVYHHIIMPLSTDLDREIEVAWAVHDFTARFGRKPEGMWLAETAVDIPTMEALAAADIKFTILAPRQAESVAEIGANKHDPVDENSLDTTRPYLVRLPSGKNIAVFFYDGPASQAVAFEGLLKDGEQFWKRITQDHARGLKTLATDGETYGHHFKFGEMALAYVIDQAGQNRDGFAMTNFAAYLADNPPTHEVKIRENTSWSCAHGIERWKSHCGCASEMHPGWRQDWRRPLRRALNSIRYHAELHYFRRGAKLFKDPRQALVDFGLVLAGTLSTDRYARKYLKPGLNPKAREKAFKLLSMQRWSLASFASCAWFFNEISRIEPVNAMTCGLRAVDLAEETGGEVPAKDYLHMLEEAESNLEKIGTGRDIWETRVLPRRFTPGVLAAHGLALLKVRDRVPAGPGAKAQISWPGISLDFKRLSKAKAEPVQGVMEVTRHPGMGTAEHKWTLTSGNDGPLLDLVSIEGTDGPPSRAADLAWNKRQAVAVAALQHAEEKSCAYEAFSTRFLPQLYQAFEEDQEFQTFDPAWSNVWASLAWHYVQGRAAAPENREYLVDFLKSWSPRHPAAPCVAEHVVESVLTLLDQAPPPWEEIKSRILRCRDIRLDVVWWRVQNRVWAMNGETLKHNPAAEVLGFAAGLVPS